MNKEELKNILSFHRMWVAEEGGERANLRDADLRDADLRWADLRWADLRDADLRDADLSGANLSGAHLRGANLSGAHLRGANLRDADLRDADLRWADLRWADLSESNLSGANLSGADLRWAHLSDTGLIVLTLPTWDAYVQRTHTRIGCQYHSNSEWRSFDDATIAYMHDDALGWWRKYKPLILSAMQAVEEG